MRIAFLNLGEQSGVTARVSEGLTALGHHLDCVNPTGVLALRDPHTHFPRPTTSALLAVAASAWRHGVHALGGRTNTPFAFDLMTRYAGEMLCRLREPPEVVLQSGVLYAPGSPPRWPYVLLCDNTCLLDEQRRVAAQAELGRPYRFGEDWMRRERATFQSATRVAAFSEAVRRSLIEDYGVRPDRAIVVGAGANIAPDDLPRRDVGRLLLFIGKGPFCEKGGQILLRAFRRVRERVPDVRLTLVGPMEPLDLPDGAVNLGLQPVERVGELLREATIFVLPALREPFGLAFLDAMACGVPCVGTEVGAIPEILGTEAGLTVPVADAEALATAILTLLEDPVRAAAMGVAGRRRVLEKGFLWPTVTGRIGQVLEVAARARPAA